MRKDFKYSINQGLPGGANELKKFVKGSISVTGYKSDSPDVNNDFNIIPSNRITMQGVNFPVLGVDDLGYEQMMMPGGEYNFPGNYVTEIPQMGKGGLTQWFAEKWTDVKTGKPCGRSGKEKGSRPYPACRPSKRVNETTPKTTSELSSAEKAKFKREKTSGKRISYNHKRKELGGEAGWLEQYQDGGWYTEAQWDAAVNQAALDSLPKFTQNRISNPGLIFSASQPRGLGYSMNPSINKQRPGSSQNTPQPKPTEQPRQLEEIDLTEEIKGLKDQWYTTQEWDDAMPDSTFENLVEFIDPTGITSYDDARVAYRDWKRSGTTIPSFGQGLEMFGAVPGLGKLSKLKYLANSKALKPLYKYFPWQQTLNAADTVQDEYEKKYGGWLEQYQFAGEPLTAPPIQNKTSFWDLMSYQKDPNNPDNYIKVNKNPNYYRFNTKLNDKGTPEIQAYQNYLNENFNTFIKEDGVWNDETKKAYEEYVVNNQNSKKSNKNKSIKLNTKEPLEFRYENGALQVKATNPEYNPDLKDWTDLKKLNPTLEEFKAVIDNVPSYNKYYENIYDADNTIRGVQAGPLDKKRQDEIIARKKYQELDPRNKEYLGKTFGNLPIVEKEGIYEGYSPSRIWTTPPGSNSKPWLGDDEVYNPDTDLRYLYFLKPKESSVFTDRQYKEELENLNCINGNCGDEYLNKANSAFSAPVLNLPKKKIKKVLPFPTGDTWKLGQQSYAEMITNPEILKYAKEKGIDLTDLGKDQYSPILAEALIGRRDAEFNNKGVVIPHSREYVPVIQDPNQFDLAGYLPITLDMFSPNMNLNAKNQALLNWDEKSKAEYFRRAGIPEDQWDQVYIHTSPFSINNYIPGKKYGGWLNKYQEGGHIIQPDETFYGIANKYGFNKQELINVNPGLDIDKIRPGQKINLPTVEKIEEVNISSANKKEPTSWYDYINPFNWGAPNYDDAGTFKQAFRKARIEDQNDFMYYGDRYSSDLAQLPENKKDIVKSNDIKITRDYNNDILYKGLSDVQKERRKKLLQSANKIANTQDNSEALEKLLVMTAVMENTLGADKNAYGRTYTRNPMSIDDIAYDDLFKVRKGAKDYTKSQKQAFDWLKTLGYDYRDMDKILRSDDPTAGMAAARLYYGRNTKPLPKENNKDALYNYYMEAYNKGGVDKYKGKSGYKDKWDKYYNLVFPENTEDKKYGGWLDSYQDGGSYNELYQPDLSDFKTSKKDASIVYPKNRSQFNKNVGLAWYKEPSIRVIPNDFPSVKRTEDNTYNYTSKYDPSLIQVPQSNSTNFSTFKDPGESVPAYKPDSKLWKEYYRNLENDPIKFLDSRRINQGYRLTKNQYDPETDFTLAEDVNVEINPLFSRISDYKNSDTYLERLAGSHYNKDIDINKWTTDSKYRENFTRKYLKEVPEAKSIIAKIRKPNYDSRILTNDMGYATNDEINANPLFHRQNKNFSYEELKKYIPKDSKDSRFYDEGEVKDFLTINDSTSRILSHELYHQKFDKSNVDGNIDNIYPENEMLFRLNNTTKDKDYNRYKDLKGYAEYDSENELPHLESPEETKADIFSARDYLYDKYDYDHINKPFTEKEFELLKNDKKYRESLIGDRLFKRFGEDKDKWIKVMNLIAKNKTNDSKTNYAKYGGWLDSYQDGGQTNWLDNYK